MRPIVFLHIPKTAGQNVHHAIGALVGSAHVSPIRVNAQAGPGGTLPPGYRFHSGHIDWTGLEALGGEPFVFTVLRDPAERIASFYFYMRAKAEAAEPAALEGPAGRHLRSLRDDPPDRYFFPEEPQLRRFVRDHYENFYCSYLATRRMDGLRLIEGLAPDEILARAAAGAAALSRIYHIDRLGALEEDIAAFFGRRVEIAGRRLNAGDLPASEARWPRLVARFESDAAARRLEGFATLDAALMDRLLPG